MPKAVASRHAYFGEQEQADATPYEWVSGKIWHLHMAIDDATSIVTGGVTRRKRFMPITMYCNRFLLPMASLLKSSLIIVPFSITKEKTPHRLMRIHRHSLDTPVNSSASG